MVRRTLFTLVGLVLLPTALVACGDDDDAGGVAIEGAWARTSPMMAEAGAAYMTITSDDGDRLVGASADEVAGRVEVHETVMADGEMADGEMADGEMEDMGGAMTMQEVEAIDLPAGETVALEPGGFHIMMLDLVEPLESGDRFELTLSLETAGDQTVTVEVRDEAP